MKREEAELKAKLAAQAEAEKELQALGANFPELPGANNPSAAS